MTGQGRDSVRLEAEDPDALHKTLSMYLDRGLEKMIRANVGIRGRGSL